MTRLIKGWLTSALPDGSTLADRPLAEVNAARVVDARHAREKVRGDKVGRVSKINTQRHVSMTARVKALGTMRRTGPDGKGHESSKYVLGNAVGERIKNIKTAWLACCRLAEVTGLHLHDLRREAASRLLEAGVGLHVVSAWLGHSSVAQASAYLSLNTAQFQDARTKLEGA